jgi:hypothetical protein
MHSDAQAWPERAIFATGVSLVTGFGERGVCKTRFPRNLDVFFPQNI